MSCTARRSPSRKSVVVSRKSWATIEERLGGPGWFRGLALGGWLAGAWNWHFLFVWPFVISGILYVVYQIFTGRFRALLFIPRDIPGVWPMAKHYFLFGKKPQLTQQYNPLQKLAYTSTIFFGVSVADWICKTCC